MFINPTCLFPHGADTLREARDRSIGDRCQDQPEIGEFDPSEWDDLEVDDDEDEEALKGRGRLKSGSGGKCPVFLSVYHFFHVKKQPYYLYIYIISYLFVCIGDFQVLCLITRYLQFIATLSWAKTWVFQLQKAGG